MAALASPALAFERVSKRYRGKRGALALDDVSWAVQSGARACLLGPNGAGKSTSIRLLQGVLQPTAGRVTLLGARADGPESRAARKRTGIVPQGPGLYRDVTTGEYLELAARLYGRRTLDAMVELFGLGPFRDKMLADLSGGFQRRVSLAVALLGEPDLLLLDEPTVGLDPVATHEVHSYLREAMSAPGRTTLLCTHNLAEAEALCDEVIILREGAVLLQESLEQLRQRAQPQLRLAARQGAPALLDALRTQGQHGMLDTDGEGVLLPVRDAAEDAPGLLRALLDAGLDVYECRPLRATLQELFLDVVRAA